MLFGRFTPMIPGQTLSDPKADYRTAEKIGPFRLSVQALYQPDGSYLLRSAIADAAAGMGCTHVTGCCAGSVPVPRVVITTTGGDKVKLMCDRESVSARLCAALTEAR